MLDYSVSPKIFSEIFRHFFLNGWEFLVRILQAYYTFLYITLDIKFFIQLSATLTKLCRIKRDNPVHIMCPKRPPSAKTHANIFCHFFQTVGNFCPNFTYVLYDLSMLDCKFFIQLSPTVTKLCILSATTHCAFRLTVDIFSI